jgi:hypothetical protein
MLCLFQLDNCDDDVEVTVTDETIPGECPQGIQHPVRIYRAFDNCGNMATMFNTYLCCRPLLHLYSVQITSLSSLTSVTKWFLLITPTATDNCGDVSYDYSDSVDEGDCDSYITRVWTATDECGNVVTSHSTSTLKILLLL